MTTFPNTIPSITTLVVFATLTIGVHMPRKNGTSQSRPRTRAQKKSKAVRINGRRDRREKGLSR